MRQNTWTKFYSSRYFVSKGNVDEYSGDVWDDGNGTKYACRAPGNIERIGRDSFYTYKEALADGIKRLERKIVSVRKQLAKLEEKLKKERAQ